MPTPGTKKEVTARLPDAPDQSRARINIMAILVIYKMRLAASPSLKSLVEAADFAEHNGIGLQISVADNTPGGQPAEHLPYEVSYDAYPDNPGLSPVYNRAILEAERAGIAWLLTLDQDTHLPVNFLASMGDLICRYESDPRVAAIVPQIFDGHRPVSPFRFLRGFLPRIASARSSARSSGLMGPHASALNSASLLRVSALRQVGGYDETFPLNNSDTALYHRLDTAGFRTVLASDIVVHHELAIMQREDRMTIERYRQLLKDERQFWDAHMSAPARAERVVRLAGRSVKAWFHHEDPQFQTATLDELRYRLFTRRSVRSRSAVGDGQERDLRSHNPHDLSVH